ncbi:MAG: ABC transporter, partial [Planktothrix sp.]
AEVLETCRQKLLTYAEIESMEGQVVRLLVKRDTLTTTVAKILAEFNILDLTVSDPPIENVIGRVFRAGVVD